MIYWLIGMACFRKRASETAESAVASLQRARRRLDKGRDASAASGRDLYATVMAMLDADRG